jgi:hypothetical protein
MERERHGQGQGQGGDEDGDRDRQTGTGTGDRDKDIGQGIRSGIVRGTATGKGHRHWPFKCEKRFKFR